MEPGLGLCRGGGGTGHGRGGGGRRRHGLRAQFTQSSDFAGESPLALQVPVNTALHITQFSARAAGQLRPARPVHLPALTARLITPT